MNKENCAFKLVDEIILYYDARSKKHKITTLHVSGSLSVHHQDFLAVHQLWYILCSCDEPFAARSRKELQFHPTLGSKRFITTT